ncbi:uncharacterized protein BXZ73DRAFT_81473 [Epithele typhae]|uniref:uncharacterized protein n=1 Tax=Epithele typhae TaxID=378194 RepID=UPI00200730E3|nr:uncharacterized protein BXZ73DRAFT_81473 [Epithele typhae]KAH9915043.1 hypothetical protein BXZ73DRAFT_81473 [Epithele typhae]
MQPLKSDAGLGLPVTATVPLASTPGNKRAVLGLRSLYTTLLATVAFATIQMVIKPTAVYPDSLRNASTRAPGAEFDWFAVEPSRDVRWVDCYEDQKCARLLLPLDYDRPNGPTTAIAIRMIPATDRENYRGTVFLNPGGPGGSGTNYIQRRGKDMSTILGPSYDILSFDPRGIGFTVPRIDCFDSKSQRDIWETQEGHALIGTANSTGTLLYRARAQLLGERCENKLGGEHGLARFVSTPYVARDMLEMTQKLGQEKLQYWGFSYGTILGQWFATLYPDKIKRLAIDGVVDGHSYRRSSYETDVVDVEAIVESLFTYCHDAGPLKCPIYDSTPDRIAARFFNTLKSISASPFPIPLADPPLIITRKVILESLFRAAYKPVNTFPLITQVFAALESHNTTALTALAPHIADPTTCSCSAATLPMVGSNEVQWAVECADSDAYKFDPSLYASFYAELESVSPLLAPVHLRALE